MKIFILGGDGFCGWPTSLKLAANGHEIVIVDNLVRRKIDIDLNSNSLTNIYGIHERVAVANDLIGNIKFVELDVAKEYHRLFNLIKDEKPNAIVHFAEQRAAPYSMISEKERRYTIDNNIPGTHNVLCAMVDSGLDIHLVHLGTMGVYGYSAAFGSIPEGYLNVKINETGEDVDILYPTSPGSVYHMTKSLDQIMFQFYNKNWKLKITDLHQGIGVKIKGSLAPTEETKKAPAFINRFDYDGIYGTVLNRFISQAAYGHNLTVYGTGGQTRAFIHIEDTVTCIRLALENPPENTDKVRIFNQVSETRTLLDLAEIIQKKYGANIDFLDNPRKEAAENDLVIHNEGLKSLGFHPIFLNEGLIDDVEFIAEQNKDKIKRENIHNSPRW
jgi:UDP-sulfoquinovose synthase